MYHHHTFITSDNMSDTVRIMISPVSDGEIGLSDIECPFPNNLWIGAVRWNVTSYNSHTEADG